MEFGGYIGLFFSAFLAATIVPFYSEAVIAGLAGISGFDAVMLVAVATVGNTLGAMVNWVLGRYLLHFQDRKWFPVKPHRMEKAIRLYNRWGIWSLLLAWAPVIGDPLTLIAGILRAPIIPFTILTAAGKCARYAVIVYAVMAATH